MLSEDFLILDNLFEKKKEVDAGVQLLNEGASFDKATVITQGWALRYKSLPDGRRQILNFLLPGDMYGLFSPLFRVAEFGVESLTAIETHSFSSIKMLEAFKASPRLGLALTWLAGMDERQLDEQILRIGKRRASERMAHLFLELHKRQVQTGINDKEARHLPITQSILADTLGMSHVHANRSFQTLKNEELVTLHDREICIKNVNKLAELANFDASYLEFSDIPDETHNILNSLDAS